MSGDESTAVNLPILHTRDPYEDPYKRMGLPQEVVPVCGGKWSLACGICLLGLFLTIGCDIDNLFIGLHFYVLLCRHMSSTSSEEAGHGGLVDWMDSTLHGDGTSRNTHSVQENVAQSKHRYAKTVK